MRPSPIRVASLFCFAVAGLLYASLCQAEVVEYTLDSERSVLTLSGTLTAVFLEDPYVTAVSGQVSANSLIDSYSGTLRASRTGNVLTFDAASSIIADENVDAPFLPTTSGAVDNYGVSASYAFPIIGTAEIVGALRNITLQLGGYVDIGELPSDMTIGIPTLVINDNYDTSYADLGQSAVANSALDVVELQVTDNVEWLTIPIKRAAVALGTAGNLDIRFDYLLTGELVAYRAVPEPGTWVLLSLSLLGLMVARRRFDASSN